MANMIGNGSCVQSELTSDGWFAPCSAELESEQTRVCGFRCSLILFSDVWIYLNHFNCSPSQSSAWRNLIWPELKQGLMFQASITPHCGNTTDPSQKGKRCVIIYFAACLLHFNSQGILGVTFTKVKYHKIDPERLHSVHSEKTFGFLTCSATTVHHGWPVCVWHFPCGLCFWIHMLFAEPPVTPLADMTFSWHIDPQNRKIQTPARVHRFNAVRQDGTITMPSLISAIYTLA